MIQLMPQPLQFHNLGERQRRMLRDSVGSIPEGTRATIPDEARKWRGPEVKLIKGNDPIPDGWRLAFLEEAAQRWKYDSAFREGLRKGAAVISNIVRKERGYYRINPNGTFDKADWEEMPALESKDKAFVTEDDPMTIYVSFDTNRPGLLVGGRSDVWVGDGGQVAIARIG